VSLVLKTSTISELENQVGELKVSFNNITADLEAARQNFENAKLAKASADKELAEANDALAASKGDGHRLEQVSDEVRPNLRFVVARLIKHGQLEAARATITEQNAVIEALREQIKALEAKVDESMKSLEGHASDADIVAAAERDRQALVEARAELETMETETAALKVAQAEALDAATAKISALELQASRAEALATEITDLHAGKEGTSNKLSELEVEILELKEARDVAEEEHGNSKTQIDTLREEVAAASAAAEKAVEEAVAKQSAATEHLEEVKKQHEAALALVVEESKQLTDQLNASQAKIDELRNNLEASDAVAAFAAEEHAGRLAEAEQAHQARQDELTAEIERISAELAVRSPTGLLASCNVHK
jgi:conserved oligomeric Golgi complex subunit 6